jgi:hypothetical protein
MQSKTNAPLLTTTIQCSGSQEGSLMIGDVFSSIHLLLLSRGTVRFRPTKCCSIKYNNRSRIELLDYPSCMAMDSGGTVR